MSESTVEARYWQARDRGWDIEWTITAQPAGDIVTAHHPFFGRVEVRATSHEEGMTRIVERIDGEEKARGAMDQFLAEALKA